MYDSVVVFFPSFFNETVKEKNKGVTLIHQKKSFKEFGYVLLLSMKGKKQKIVIYD
jgi:hypothetical protein